MSDTSDFVSAEVVKTDEFFNQFIDKDIILWIDSSKAMFHLKDVKYELNDVRKDITFKNPSGDMFWTSYKHGFGLKRIEEPLKYWVDCITDDGRVVVITYKLSSSVLP